MMTDVFTIKGADSVSDALFGLFEAGGRWGIKEEDTARIVKLGIALLQIAEKLRAVRLTQLWMRADSDEAVIFLKVHCTIDLKEAIELRALSTTGGPRAQAGPFGEPNRQAPNEAMKLADQITVGFSSERIEIAAHVKVSQHG